jgi:CotH protein.
MQYAKNLQITQCILAVIVALFMTTTAFAQSGFNIVKQVAPITIVPKGLMGTLTFSVNYEGNEVSYQWYQTYKYSSKADWKIEGATNSSYGVTALNEKEVRFFYCIATYNGKTLKSNVATVVTTGLPQLHIRTPGKVEIDSKDVWTDNASITLNYAEKDAWNFSGSTSIRGRGNSTWGGEKKPYALKLNEKREIMGMPLHKRWVLMAGYYDNSFMKNHIAFYLSEKLKMDYTVHGKFVDLFINDTYRGLYWLGEAIKVDDYRVNINDGYKGMPDGEDKDFLIEMDVYFDEPVKFETSIRKMPYMIRNDDYMIDDNNAMTSGGNARLARFQKKIEKLEKMLYPDYVSGMKTENAAPPDERYSKIIDVDSWAKFWLINELMDNVELEHPKSCYFTYQNDIDLFKAGPAWDFDWGVLSENTTSLRNYIYYDALFKSPLFMAAVRRIWDTYSEDIDVSSEIEKMREYLRPASVADSVVWDIHYHPIGVKKSSFDEYVDFLEVTINKKLGLVGKFITDTLPKVKVISPKIVIHSDKLEYSGSENAPLVTVLDDAYTVLKEGVDYTLSYANNINIGTASMHFEGKGHYAGLKDTTFSIVPKSVVVYVDSLSKFYGEEDPELSYTVDGLLSFGGAKDRLNEVELVRQPGENAGEYVVSAIVNLAANPSYYSVTVKNGVLSINPDTTKIVVSVKGSTDTVEYDGKKHSVRGFEMTSGDDDYSLDFVNYKGDSLVSGTNAKTYPMGLVAKDFENTSVNYSNVVFDITDGNLVITPKPAVLTVADASKTYGKKDPKLKYSVEGLLEVDGTKDSLKGVALTREAGEDAGEYAIKATIDSAATSNYALSVEEGLFTINPDTTKIVVTVKGHKDTVVYDGKKHSVRGFDMKSSLKAYSVDFVSYKGDSLASGTKVKTYAMGLVAKDFKNTSVNYTNVVFKVEDGSLTIKKKEKKDALLASRVSVGLLKVYAMDRRIQVNTSMTGERFAVYDMQGVVVLNGLVNAASFEIQIPKAGAYMVRVGSLAQRVDVR